MEASLLGAELSVALRQPAYDEADEQPRVDAPQHGSEKTEPRPLEGLGGPTHRLTSLVVVAAVGIAQLIWIAVLAYAFYWIGARLPL